MNGPEEATQESVWPFATLWPRKRGHSRVFAAFWMSLVRGFVGELYWDSTSYISYKYPCRATERGNPETGA